MLYRNLIAFLAVAASVNAEVHDIDVGEDGKLAFKPNELKAVKGDQLRFRFYDPSGPHDVVQGSLDQPGPCQPSTDAFYSGRMTGDDDGNQIFTVNVTSSDPIYFYCSINRHCQQGMVGVVNPPPGAGYAFYKSRSIVTEASNQPSDVSGGVVGVDRGGDDSTSSITSAGTSSAAAPATTGSGTTEATTGSTTRSAGTSPSTTAPAQSSGNTASGAAGSAATTTPSGAGRNGQTTVVLGLAVILGGLVALMA